MAAIRSFGVFPATRGLTVVGASIGCSTDQALPDVADQRMHEQFVPQIVLSGLHMHHVIEIEHSCAEECA